MKFPYFIFQTHEHSKKHIKKRQENDLIDQLIVCHTFVFHKQHLRREIDTRQNEGDYDDG